MAKIRLCAYSAAHFLVDFSCALLVLGRICGNSDIPTVLFFYNLFAFAVQMPVGLLADRFGHCKLFASAGCLLVFAAWLLPASVFAASVAGLGNAAFHIGGGLDTLNSTDRSGPLGLFVSPGAFGIYFGTLLAGSFPPPIICTALLAASALLPLLRDAERSAPLALPRVTTRFAIAAACLFAVVVLRSWLGLAADLPWKAEYGLLAVAAVAFGKATGGYLADRFGILLTAVVSLAVSALCFVFGGNAAFGIAALLCFNMTMPLTLSAAARIMPGIKGFSFGLLTFALFIGLLPVLLGDSTLAPSSLAVGAAVSIPLLAVEIAAAKEARRV